MFNASHSRGLRSLESQHTGGGSALQIRDPDHINDRHEKTEAERHNQDDLLLLWETHPREDRHGQEENCKIRDDIDRRGGQIQREDVRTRRTRRYGVGKPGPHWITLEDVYQRQPQSCRVHHEERRIIRPTEDLFAAREGQVEDENRCFDRHQRGVLDNGQHGVTTEL